MSTPKHPVYILKRPSGLYFRIKVPADVRHLIGKTELKRSLVHLSEKAAHREAARLSALAYYLFENARNQSNQHQINQFDGLLAAKDWKSISIRVIVKCGV